MTEKLSELILEAASKTFESLAFLEVYPAEETISYDPSETMGVHLLVLDPYPGSLGLQTSKTFLTAIATSLFAIPAHDITITQLNDLLNELLNTLAGSFLSNALPTDKPFKIGLPLLGTGNDQLDDLSFSNWDFESDEGNFTVYAAGEILEKL